MTEIHSHILENVRMKMCAPRVLFGRIRPWLNEDDDALYSNSHLLILANEKYAIGAERGVMLGILIELGKD
jgi:hypothetical protein